MAKITREQHYSAVAILQTMPPEDMEPIYLAILEEMDSAFVNRRPTALTPEEIQEAMNAYSHYIQPPQGSLEIMMKLPVGSVRLFKNKYLTFRLVINEETIAWETVF